MKTKGTVYLVGAGPGDAGLLTLRGAELLGAAEVVVYDTRVNPELLRRAPNSAEIIHDGEGSAPGLPIAELGELLIGRARASKTVVYLMGGDPYLFGRGAQVAERLADARVPFEVVPGVSPVVAAANYAGVPLTHRDYVSQLTLIAGGAAPTSGDAGIDWARVASTPGTKVIMLDADQLGPVARALANHGLSHTTPVALAAWGADGPQRSVADTIGGIADTGGKEKIDSPAVAVIGDVVKLRDKLNWFEHRPLFGQRIVVTRSREQTGQFARRLQEQGADVIEIPTIKIEAPSRRQDLVDALLELNSYDWLVFTSPNGVTAFFEYFFRHFHDMRDLGGARLAAVGPATANKLKELHLQVDLMPEEALSSKIAEAFAKFETIENLKICLLRAEVANRELPEALEELGAIVDDVPCYQTVPETQDTTGAAASLLAKGADWIAFTSGSTVAHFHARFNLPDLMKKFPQLQTATIGPETSKALAQLGLTPTIEAKEHTIDGLVRALSARSKPTAS
jgi:uroporphyrinogen III methyltransferase / synthase